MYNVKDKVEDMPLYNSGIDVDNHINNYDIMLLNKKIMQINFDTREYEVFHGDLLPFTFRSITDKNKMFDAVRDWLASRILTLSRSNMKQLYTCFNIPQTNKISDRVRAALVCKAVSVNDCYWVKSSYENLTWDNVDVRSNNLIDILNVALYGESPTFRVTGIHPDKTTVGIFPKGWTIIDNNLILIKGDTLNGANVKSEVLSSDFCEMVGIPHVQYNLLRGENNSVVSSCGLMNKDNCCSYITAQEIIDYCYNNGIPYNYYIEEYLTDFANMVVLDYLIANPDRHTENYMFKMDNTTGEIIGLGELFDFNQSFISDMLGKEIDDAISPTLPDITSTLLEVAIKYYRYSIFKTHKDVILDNIERCGVFNDFKENIIKRYNRLDEYGGIMNERK